MSSCEDITVVPEFCVSQGDRVGGFQAFPALAKRRSEILQGPGFRSGSGVTWGRLIANILLEGLLQG